MCADIYKHNLYVCTHIILHFFVYPYMTYLHFFAFWNLELHQEKQENQENYPYVNIRSSAFSNSSTSDVFLKIEYVTF